MIGTLLGGIGLFLLGMSLMTEGLEVAAGSALRDVLRRSTRSRLSAIATGAGVTALVQSSSATTLATIGFVGAGILPYGQALGVIYGANVGTTLTAWLVAAVGLKVKISIFALPLVGIGAVVRLLGRGRRAAVGSALAGFGLVFVGIDLLQAGLTGLSTYVDPASYAIDGFIGRVVLVIVGVVMTIVMQSSSAAVATTLTAVSAGALNLEQAAAVVIGQNVGTTVTALIGSVGGSVPARRIAVGHVLFNLGTGVIALALLPIFTWLVVEAVGEGEPAVALAGFHTAFNLVGVLLFAPFSNGLARVLTRLVPDRGDSLTASLSRAAASGPTVAVAAARVAALEIARAGFRLAISRLGGDRTTGPEASAEEVQGALAATRDHLRAIRSDPTTPDVFRGHVSVLHALDHLHRLVEAAGESREAAPDQALQGAADALAERLGEAARWIETPGGPPPALEAVARTVAELRVTHRHDILEQTARGELGAELAEVILDALHRVERIAYHAHRAMHHLAGVDAQSVPQAEPAPPALSN